MWSGTGDFLRSTSKLYHPTLLRTTWPLQTIWFSLNFGSYGILTWINTLFIAVHLDNVYFNAFLFAASNLPGNIVSGLFMDYTGRTCMLVTSSLAAAASLLTFAYFAAQESAEGHTLNATGIVISACSFQAFSIAAWNTIDCMTTERFPTSVRSTGMGVCAASGRIGAMVAQIVNGALVHSPVRLLLVASTSLLVAAMTPLLLPYGDYANRELEDDLDGKATDIDGEMECLNHTDNAQSDRRAYVRISGYQQGLGKPIQSI
jgi:MFS family permease